MTPLERFASIFRDELEKAVADPLDTLLASLPPGLVLLPFPVIFGVLGTSVYDWFVNTASNLRRVPAVVLARILSDLATKASTTQVCRISDAKKLAVDLCVATVFELTGTNPPPSLHASIKISKIKGLRKRVIAIEERQILGGLLKKFFSILRAPVVYALETLKRVWEFLVIVAALGAVVCVYHAASADWDSIALSQRHPRRRERVRINRRL